MKINMPAMFHRRLYVTKSILIVASAMLSATSVAAPIVLNDLTVGYLKGSIKLQYYSSCSYRLASDEQRNVRGGVAEDASNTESLFNLNGVDVMMTDIATPEERGKMIKRFKWGEYTLQIDRQFQLIGTCSPECAILRNINLKIEDGHGHSTTDKVIGYCRL